MYMFSEIFEENRADYCDSGYIPLYPLLNGYWNKMLSDMPQTLRHRVEKAVPGWNDIYYLRAIGCDLSNFTIPQARVRLYDIQRDHTQERKTYIALEGYIRGGYSPTGYPLGKFVPDGEYFRRGQLPERIDNAISHGMASVADAMRDDVALPLEKICSEVGTHWPCAEPLLWEALCKFREMTLPGLIVKATWEANEDLISELDYVSTYIYRILNLERHNVDPVGKIESRWKGHAVEQPQLDLVKLKKNSMENHTLQQVWNGDRKIESEWEGYVAEQAAPAIGVVANIKASDDPRGKMPRTAAGMLTVKAAWQIECMTGRKTTDQKVMELLQKWATNGDEGELIKSIPHGVIWVTKKGRKEKPYMIEHCGKHLANWYESRSVMENLGNLGGIAGRKE